MSEKSINEEEMRTKIEELQKYKIDNIDNFKENFSEKNKLDTHTYYQYLNYQVSPELKKIKRQFYNYDDNSEDDGNYLKYKEKIESIVNKNTVDSTKCDNITEKGVNIFYAYNELYNNSIQSLGMLDTELINRITNPHLKIQYGI